MAKIFIDRRLSSGAETAPKPLLQYQKSNLSRVRHARRRAHLEKTNHDRPATGNSTRLCRETNVCRAISFQSSISMRTARPKGVGNFFCGTIDGVEEFKPPRHTVFTTGVTFEGKFVTCAFPATRLRLSWVCREPPANRHRIFSQSARSPLESCAAVFHAVKYCRTIHQGFCRTRHLLDVEACREY